MPRRIVRPSCGESEDINGSRTAEGIVVSCRSCKARWPRDSVPDTCATCGGTGIEFHPQALTQYARGTQVSIVGWRHGPVCSGTTIRTRPMREAACWPSYAGPGSAGRLGPEAAALMKLTAEFAVRPRLLW